MRRFSVGILQTSRKVKVGKQINGIDKPFIVLYSDLRIEKNMPIDYNKDLCQ
jgi:hypothetical protein